jgi:hypothetical protein
VAARALTGAAAAHTVPATLGLLVAGTEGSARRHALAGGVATLALLRRPS